MTWDATEAANRWWDERHERAERAREDIARIERETAHLAWCAEHDIEYPIDGRCEACAIDHAWRAFISESDGGAA